MDFSHPIYDSGIRMLTSHDGGVSSVHTVKEVLSMPVVIWMLAIAFVLCGLLYLIRKHARPSIIKLASLVTLA